MADSDEERYTFSIAYPLWKKEKKTRTYFILYIIIYRTIKIINRNVLKISIAKFPLSITRLRILQRLFARTLLEISKCENAILVDALKIL